MATIIYICFYAIEIAFAVLMFIASYNKGDNESGFASFVQISSFCLFSASVVLTCASFIFRHSLFFTQDANFEFRIAIAVYFTVACPELFKKKRNILIGIIIAVIGIALHMFVIVKHEDEMIRWKRTPQSSCFSEIGYNSETADIAVTFRDSGETYLYDNDDSLTWELFVESDSLGTYYNENIKGIYDCRKIS